MQLKVIATIIGVFFVGLMGSVLIFGGEERISNQENTETGVYDNQEYGFSLSYPSNWTVCEEEELAPPGGEIEELFVTLCENASPSRLDAWVMINAGGQVRPFEEIENTMLEENESEYFTLLQKPERTSVDGYPCLEVKYKKSIAKGNLKGDYRGTSMWIKKDNTGYIVEGSVRENRYGELKSSLKLIFLNFSVK